MTKEEEINSLEAELQYVQNEIDRRHQRVDDDMQRGRNLEKIDELRLQKQKINEQLAKLRA